MTFRFASLGSGSRGNALLVEHDDTLIMIDCGLARKTLEQRLSSLERTPRDLDAVLITHEHGDHCQGIRSFRRRYRTPVWTTPGTASAIASLGPRNGLSSHRELRIGSITVEPFPVPHDAREPCQFAFRAAERKLGVLTDTGHITPAIAKKLSACNALAVECNHDVGMLEDGAYPASVKARVGSHYGHLNNDQTAELLARIQHPGLQWVVGLHLSERNNSVELVHKAVAPVLSECGLKLQIATQDEPTGWFDID